MALTNLTGCTLIGSLPRSCTLSSGGIKEVKLKIIQDPAVVEANFTGSSGSITAVAVGSRTLWYTYWLARETANFTDNLTVDPKTGSSFYKPTVKIIINKLRTQVRNEIEILGGINPVQIAVWDNNDSYWLLGLKNGLQLTTTNIGTGTARGDRSGYELDFIGDESVPKLSLTQAIYDSLVTA